MTHSHCTEKVARYLGRALTDDELNIVEYLCSFGFAELEVSEAIATFIFLCYIAAIEKELGRRLSTEERTKAKELFKKGVSAKDAAIQIQPPPQPKLRTSSTPRP